MRRGGQHIFHLRLHAGPADIHFCADACLAQIGNHFLVAAKVLRILVHHQHDHRANRVGNIQLAEILQRGHQARNTDGETRRGNRLATEARDETVIAPAATDRTEHDLLAVLIGDVEQKLRLKTGPV